MMPGAQHKILALSYQCKSYTIKEIRKFNDSLISTMGFLLLILSNASIELAALVCEYFVAETWGSFASKIPRFHFRQDDCS